MNKINIPGFVAERSLESNRKTYPAAFSITSKSQVVPAMDAGCWVDRFNRTYFACTYTLGYGAGVCAQTAKDLADFICQ